MRWKKNASSLLRHRISDVPGTTLRRSSAVGNYVIFYRVREDGIEVVRVLHAARDIPEFF
jgi:plasmid stabilization system protein ParE